MEGLIFLAVIYFVFKAMGEKGQKFIKRMNQKAGNNPALPKELGDMMAWFKDDEEQKAESHEATAFVQPKPVAPAAAMMENQMAAEGSGRFGVLKPSIQSGVAFRSLAQGEGIASLEGTASAEGEDTCDTDLLHGRRSMDGAFVQAEEPRAALQLDWTANAMMQAVVMNEVLNRPYKWSENRG